MARRRIHAIVMTTALVAAVTIPSALVAQSESPPALGPTPSSEGPTREAEAATARDYLDPEGDPVTPRLMPRYQAFQREFVSDFGAPRIADRLDPLLAFRARLEDRWGDTSLYQWLERGIAFYSWIQSSTRTETKGFDVEVKTGGVAGGKLGVRMVRPLGSGAVE